MEHLANDLRYAFRRLLAHPGFTLAAIATLALGIGANTAIFSLIRGVLLKPLPYANGESVVVLAQHPNGSATDAGFSPIEIGALRDRSHTLDDVAEYHNMWFILLGRKEPERVHTGVVSANFFDLFGVKAALGRTFLPEDEKPESPAVLVLSDRYWRKSFGADTAIVGKVFEMNDRPHTVIGVLPPIPQYPDDNDVYMPTTACPFRSAPATISNPQARMTTAFALVKPGTPLSSVKGDLEAVSAGLAKEYPKSFPLEGAFTMETPRLKDELTRQAKPTFLMLLGATGLVLLIACANVANLSVAQLLKREHELAVRTALGAGRGRLLRQLLTESTLLALLGGLAGVLLALWGLDLLIAFAARFTPRADGIRIDGAVLLFNLVVSLAAGIGFGLLPALPARRTPASALVAGGARTTSGLSGSRLRGFLIVSQVAVSFILLIGATLLIRSLLNLQRVDPGIDTERVMTMRVDLNFSRYDTPEKRRDFHVRLLERLKGQPGVVSAAIAGTFPLNERGPFNTRFVVEGRPVPPGQLMPEADVRVASPDYFTTVRVPLLQGRAFTDADGPDAPGVTILSRSMATHYWGSDDVIGRRISPNGGDKWLTIVGVVADVRQRLDAEPKDELYLPILQAPLLSTNPVVRTAGDPRAISRALHDAVHAVDPQQPVDSIRTLAEVRKGSLAPPRLTAVLLGLFAAVALLITATGIGGVVAFSVTQRTQEIGIRMALGAERGDVLALVLRPGLSLVLVGLTVGAAGAFALTRFLAALLFGIGPTDPTTFALVALTLAAVATAASFIPARRATAIEPMAALRTT